MFAKTKLGFGIKRITGKNKASTEGRKKYGSGYRKKKPAGGRKKKCGSGYRKKKAYPKKSGGFLPAIAFQYLLKKVNDAVKKSPAKTGEGLIGAALNFAKKFVKGNNIQIPSVIPVKKSGGILPLIPIFAGLSALGALSGGAAQIARAVKESAHAREQLKEANRHNKTIEAIALGRGLFLRPYSRGYGIYVPKN